MARHRADFYRFTRETHTHSPPSDVTNPPDNTLSPSMYCNFSSGRERTPCNSILCLPRALLSFALSMTTLPGLERRGRVRVQRGGREARAAYDLSASVRDTRARARLRSVLYTCVCVCVYAGRYTLEVCAQVSHGSHGK